MPRHFAPAIAAMGSSVYSALAHKLSQYTGEIYPLHVGDTWMEPAAGCRMEDLRVADHPGMHRYAPVRGRADLIDAICERTTRTQGLATSPEQVLVTAGATGGLGTVAGAILKPGDEVLILAPFWPLIAGIVKTFGGTAVPVPFFGEVDSLQAALDAIEAKRSDRTVALYVNTPHNPTGRVIPGDWLEAMAAWVRKHDLWLIADEVYEHYAFDHQHVYTRPFAPERTFSAHSFSKAYGMAGNRAGYMVGPAEAVDMMRRVATHSFYSTPTASQLAALRALGGPGDEWAAAACAQYRETGAKVAARLGAPKPSGSTFLFLDVKDALDDRGLSGLLDDVVSQGLLVAPGPSFGPYPHHVRLCFTSAPEDVVLRGVEVLAKRLGR